LNRGSVLGVLGALLMLVALIAGCGGGDSTTTGAATPTTSEAPLTKAEFIKKGDAICKTGNEASTTEIEEFAKENGFGSEPSKAQFEEVVTEVLAPNLAKQAEELDALVPPTQDEDKIEALISSLNETIARMEKNPSSLEENALAKPIQLEKAYGFKVCGGG
jgi:hypothetical protein